MRDKIVLLQTRMERLFWKIAAEKEQIVVDGVPGYNEKAQFTNGKVINLCSWVASVLLKGTQNEEKGLRTIRETIHLTARMKMETWGILNAIEGLYRLRQHGLLESAVDEETLKLLKQNLDWRTFVDENDHFALIDKPTNYYGVAFGIARYRELLQWEEEKYSEILLNKLTKHISRYSGAYGFMDETPGAGRFDRYSILISAEITALVLDTGWQEPELIRTMLNKSAHIVLQFANREGTGFSYGRSIGAYGETAALQILSTAAALGGIFTREEERLVYGYCCRILSRMIDFWYDRGMESINLWENGRKTDGYRNKNRILGENISLFMQMIGAMDQWSGKGYRWEKEPEGWEAMLQKLPSCSMTLFTDDPLPRALIMIRNRETVWQLPVISGGEAYFDRDPYLPVPRANLTLEAVPDAVHGAWLPCLELKDGSLLLPAACVDSVSMEQTESGHAVYLRQNGFVQAEQRPMELIHGAEIITAYTFQPGSILREDEIRLSPELQERISCLRLACDVMEGWVKAEGYETEKRMTYDQSAAEGVCLDTPHGPCRETILFEKRTLPQNGIIRVSWKWCAKPSSCILREPTARLAEQNGRNAVLC